jgi:hypothetical protein
LRYGVTVLLAYNTSALCALPCDFDGPIISTAMRLRLHLLQLLRIAAVTAVIAATISPGFGREPCRELPGAGNCSQCVVLRHESSDEGQTDACCAMISAQACPHASEDDGSDSRSGTACLAVCCQGAALSVVPVVALSPGDSVRIAPPVPADAPSAIAPDALFHPPRA